VIRNLYSAFTIDSSTPTSTRNLKKNTRYKSQDIFVLQYLLLFIVIYARPNLKPLFYRFSSDESNARKLRNFISGMNGENAK
jgi:hypothetical protein